MIPLHEAVLCSDLSCQTVWSIRAHKTCPRCGFTLFVTLSRVLNRQETPHALPHRLPAGVGPVLPFVGRGAARADEA